IAVDDARSAADRATHAGLRAADAPVSGGVVGAEAGTLAFMVGAYAQDLPEITAVLDPMAGKVVHCGDSGAGQAAKVCNNLMLAISMVGVSEAFVLGEKLGLTDKTIFDVTSAATGQCWALTTNCPVPGPVPTSPANRDFKPGFASPLMAKDLGLAMQAAELTGTDTQVGRLVQEIYREFADGDGAQLDFSGIINRVRKASGDQ
ncbi:MAG: NAD-binding protein, partial [Aeromicrobium sp.]